jgi:hypothetical protein
MNRVGVACLLALVGCGGGGGGAGDDGDDVLGDPDAAVEADAAVDAEPCSPLPELCSNDVDDDCDDATDCADPDCADDALSCPACGELHRVGRLPLPDGQCPPETPDQCAGYETAITVDGFGDEQIIEGPGAVVRVCVTIEHSWMRDLGVSLRCPSGNVAWLVSFGGQTGGQVYLGEPNDSDGEQPSPGVGWEYCWTPTAENAPWIPYADANNPGTLPAGDYQSSESLDLFVGCALDGDWTLRVEDRWAIDNGYMFGWSIGFDEALVADCASWP